jgi:hypothetical protein
MSIDGTYGFVYCGVNGLGCGVFTVIGGKLTGEDYVGGKYTGNATERPDGTIKLSLSFEVRPGRGLRARYRGAGTAVHAPRRGGVAA